LSDDQSIVYPAAGAGVIHNLRRGIDFNLLSLSSMERVFLIFSGTQRFYLKHTDDIISMAVFNSEKNTDIIASGQIGENPTIHVWNPHNVKTLSVLSGRHKRGSNNFAFSIQFFSQFFCQWQITSLIGCRCSLYDRRLALARRFVLLFSSIFTPSNH
jgi:WD40 repeat protein